MVIGYIYLHLYALFYGVFMGYYSYFHCLVGFLFLLSNLFWLKELLCRFFCDLTFQIKFEYRCGFNIFFCQ